jgi:hypothetical protein
VIQGFFSISLAWLQVLKMWKGQTFFLKEMIYDALLVLGSAPRHAISQRTEVSLVCLNTSSCMSSRVTNTSSKAPWKEEGTDGTT